MKKGTYNDTLALQLIQGKFFIVLILEKINIVDFKKSFYSKQCIGSSS